MFDSQRDALTASQGLAQKEQDDKTNVESEPVKRKPSAAQGQSATHASFFGGAITRPEDEMEISSSDDDELDEEEDATLLEAKHARKERELRAQLVDVSAREYRATSPLESIARLARLSAKDLERLSKHRQEDMEVDDGAAESGRVDVSATTLSSGSEDGPEVSTPRGDLEAKVTVREMNDGHGNIRRMLRKTPEVISLPYMLKEEEVLPFQETDVYQDIVRDLEEAEPDLVGALQDIVVRDQEVEEKMMTDFSDAYRAWRESCEQLDRVKEEQEKLERQLSQEPGPDSEMPLPPPMPPVVEGRRAYKNSSEYEIEQVLKQSEETARIEQEKLDREAKKVQADMEKEALLPDQETENPIGQSLLINVNRLRDPEQLTLAFSYEPPPDDFDEKEQEVFIAAFKETPKKWGEIASLLPGRSYKDCIHHYYANKWDGRFRDSRTKKFKGGRRGRGGKASRPSRGSALMADLNRGEDMTVTDTTTGRPKRAAAPTTFGEKEAEAKNSLAGPSPAKKLGPGSKQDGNGEDKPVKKQRRTGEGKPGRKGKAQAQLAALAPSMSPNKQAASHAKEELARATALEEASLLANLQGGHHSMMHPPESHMIFNQEGLHNQMSMDDADLHRPMAPTAKQSASSYWSVPEQTDFAKYIAHFGTDFAAIATHMGTKTQTMIKNHYQRQVDGGRAELQEAATMANQRRDRGEDIGPPPTPTPITKRKYDNPQSGTPRNIAPQNDAMDIDEPVPQTRPTVPQHASPPQFQAQPRYTTSAQSTPIPAQRVVPSPLPVTATPASALPPAPPHSRGGLQHPLGSRFSLLSENRTDHRPGMQQNSMFRMGQEAPPLPPRSQPQAPSQPSRTLSTAPDSQFIHNLRQEQERALRMQAAQNEQETRIEHMHGRQPGIVPHTQGSPANQPLSIPTQERKPLFDERGRVPTPPRGSFLGAAMSRPPLLNPNPSTGSIPPLGASPLHLSAHRSPYNPSPPKPELSRPSSVSASQAPPSGHFSSTAAANAPAPAPEPKKSNLMSILNNTEPEETKPAPKRDSLPSAGPTRVASPAQPFGSATNPQPMSNAPTPRRDTFGQSSLPHSAFHRSSFGSTPGPMPPLKQESSAGGTSSMQQPSKDHWQSRMMGQSNMSNNASLDKDRELRPPYGYSSHRSSAFAPPRANPSPPPHVFGHSRTPSHSAQQAQQGVHAPREQTRSILGNHPPTTQPSLHSNPYARQEQPPPFSQAPPPTQSRAHHSHNSSLGGEGPPIMQRFHGAPLDRDELYRREDEVRMQQQHQQNYRRAEEASRFEALQRERERAVEQQHEMERARHEHAYSRNHGLPPQSITSTFSSPFGQARQPTGMLSTREQGIRDAGAAIQHEEQQRLEHDERRRATEQHSFMREKEGTTQFGGRLDDRHGLFRGSTPQGYRNGPGPPYAPPPSRGR